MCHMKSEKEGNIRLDVVDIAKAVFHKGLVDFAEGNVSARFQNKNEILITPSFNHYETMTKADVVHLNFDGSKLSEGKNASSEYRLHVAIYKARPKAKYVVHTHSPYATMISIVRKKIPVLMEEMVMLIGGAVNVAEFGIAHTEDIGQYAVKALGTTNATLLANHGALVCGRTIEHVVKVAELVEKMALIYWGSSQIGEPQELSESACNKLKEHFHKKFSTCS